MKRPHLPYRPCAGIMLFNQQAEVFVGSRLDGEISANEDDYWQMPQGGIDPGEDPLAAAWRELEEETGTRKARLLAESQDWHTYDLPDHLIGKIWDGKYCGQRQKWFAMAFEGADSDINLDTENPEFKAWKWVPLAQIPDLIVPFKKGLYQGLVREFTPTAQALLSNRDKN